MVLTRRARKRAGSDLIVFPKKQKMNSLKKTNYPRKVKISRKLKQKLDVINIQKSKRDVGASHSSSKGFVKGGSKKIKSEDIFATRGIVVHREQGGVVSTNGTEKAQALLIGHSNFTKSQLLYDICTSLVKMIATKMGRNIASFDDSVFAAGSGIGLEYVWIMEYGTHPAASVSPFSIVSVPGVNQSWTYVRDTLFSQMTSLINAHSGFYLNKWWVQQKDNNSSIPNYYPIVEIDMMKCRVQLYCKSAMKFQNRSINSTGNTDSNDVDNVPLYGKTYNGYGNYVIVSNVGYATDTNTVVATPNFINLKASSSSNPVLREPLGKSQIVKAKTIGKIHMEPAEIKTSILVYRKSHNLNSLLRQLARVGNETTNSQFIELGRFRFIHMEKMLQAVATTDINAFNVAWEVDQKTGVICTAPKVRVTNYIELLSTV